MGDAKSVNRVIRARSCPAIALMAPPKSPERHGTVWILILTAGLTRRASAARVSTMPAMTPHFHSVHSRAWWSRIQRALSAAPAKAGGTAIPVSLVKEARQDSSKQLFAIDAGVLSG